MKKALYHSFGDPAVLTVEEVALPTPGKGQVLVKMIATSVNGGDLPLRRGEPAVLAPLMRFPQGTGIDVCGTVEALGEGVTDFRVGDLVWGNSGPFKGTAAEYYLVKASKIALAPTTLSPAETAAISTVAITAYTALMVKGKLKPGEHVLIRGIGGVGQAAVQIALAQGAHVTALSSPSTVENVKVLGAQVVLDYRSTSLESIEDRYDVIFDTAGGPEINKLFALLKPKGRLLTVNVGLIGKSIASLYRGVNRLRVVLAVSNRPVLDKLTELVNQGKLKGFVDSTYPLSEVAQAHARAEQKGLWGKVIIQIP